MKIISLNVSYGEIADELYDFVKSQISDTDILCFQEMTGGNTSTIINDFLKPNFQIVSSAKEIEDGKYAQLNCVKNEFEVTDEEVLFQRRDDLGIVNVTRAKNEGNDMVVVNVHGISQPGEKLDNPNRLKQSKGIINYLADKSGQKIIVGDFNLMPETESIRMFEKAGYRNLIKEYDITNTRNHYVWDRYPDTPQYYSDYAFVPSDVKVKNFEVLPDEVSDHQPLLLEVG